MSVSLERERAWKAAGPACLLVLAAGMSFGLGRAAAQDGDLGGATYPEEQSVYEDEATLGGDAHPAETSPAGDASANAMGDPDAMGDPNAGAEGVSVSEYLTVDIFVQDEDLANVLQMLSLQSQRNIVASRDVSATVSANLYGVTFYEALDAILHVNGYSWYEEGNFIYVVTAAEAQAREEAQREIVAKVISLNYLNANDAAEFVTPLLSEVGQIKTNGDVGEYNLPNDNPAGGEDFANTSTLVIFDYPEHVEEVEALVKQLDTRPAQVLVEATILQTQLTEANAFGVDFAILADMDFLDFFNFGGPLGSANAIAGVGENEVLPTDDRGASFVGTPGNFAGPATFKTAILYDDIGLFIRALDEVSDTTILSNPKVLALNRQPARVLVGRKLGYLNTTATETATTQTVEFLDTGTQLAFRPFIAKDGNIRMELKPRVSEGVIREASDVSGSAVTIPDEITQELTTNVIVPDGATIVLGGLFKETSRLSRSQVPLVGDIPIIGAAFRGHDDNTDRAEVIFMIKPTIVNDQVLTDQGDRGMEYVDDVRTGTRMGLLPWSRERQTTQLNVKAQQLAMEGQYERALWHLRRSLELKPDQPIAIRMMQQISDEKKDWPTPSLLDRVIRGEVEKTYDRLGEGEFPYDGEAIGAFDHYQEPIESDVWDIFAEEKGEEAAARQVETAVADPDAQTGTGIESVSVEEAIEPFVDETDVFDDTGTDDATAEVESEPMSSAEPFGPPSEAGWAADPSDNWFEEVFGGLEDDPALTEQMIEEAEDVWPLDDDATNTPPVEETEVTEVPDEPLSRRSAEDSALWMDRMFDSIESFGKAPVGDRSTSSIVPDVKDNVANADPTSPAPLTEPAPGMRPEWFDRFLGGESLAEQHEASDTPVVNGLPIFNWWYSPLMNSAEQPAENSELTNVDPDNEQ